MFREATAPDATEIFERRPKKTTLERLGRYRLERLLGTGGMAEVYLARAEGHGGFEKQVVVKRIRPALLSNKKFVDMFLREAKILASLSHPNIVQTYELDREGDEYFLAMEYLDGMALSDLALRAWGHTRRLPIEAVLRIVSDALVGLDFAHNMSERGTSLGLVHRDVSPENLFVTRAGVIKVLDFGIAKQQALQTRSSNGELKGKVPYMSPEQLRGEPLDGRSDLFSVGVLLYWLLTGRRPFDGPSDLFTMKSILEAEPKRLRLFNPHVPPVLEEIVLAALEKNPAHRPQSCLALHEALEAIMRALPRATPTPASLVADISKLKDLDRDVFPTRAAECTVVWPDMALNDAGVPMCLAPIGGFDDVSLSGKHTATAPRVSGTAQTRGTPPRLPPQTEPNVMHGRTDEAVINASTEMENEMLPRSSAELDVDEDALTYRRPATAATVRRAGTGPSAKVQVHVRAISKRHRRRPRASARVGAVAAVFLVVVGGASAWAGSRLLAHEVPQRSPAQADAPTALRAPRRDAVAQAESDEARRDATQLTSTAQLAANRLSRTIPDVPNPGEGGRAPVVPTRIVALSAPSTIRWLLPSGEIVGLGTRSVELGTNVSTLIAYDRGRGVKTPMSVVGGKADYTMLPQQRLVVQSDQPAQVLLGNERIGRTPLRPLNVVPGVYFVRFMWDKRERTVSVEVKPGRDSVVEANIER